MAKKDTIKKKNVQTSETYTHIYQGVVQSVSVGVHINYHMGTVSLIENNPNNLNQAKTWLFKNRGAEYFQGWQDILCAMKSAIDDAAQKLEEYSKINGVVDKI